MADACVAFVAGTAAAAVVAVLGAELVDDTIDDGRLGAAEPALHALVQASTTAALTKTRRRIGLA